MRRAVCLIAASVLLAGCGDAKPPPSRPRIPQALLAGERPIGRGPRFQPALLGHASGACLTPLGTRLEAHVEVFGANRVVLLPAGIGARDPRRFVDGRLVHAACFGDLVTLDPTGTVYFRPGSKLTVGDLFRSWGQQLTAERIASFTGGRVRVYVNGHAHPGPAPAVRLTPGAEIVLEVGPRVPPHRRFVFPRLPSRNLR